MLLGVELENRPGRLALVSKWHWSHFWQSRSKIFGPQSLKISTSAAHLCLSDVPMCLCSMLCKNSGVHFQCAVTAHHSESLFYSAGASMFVTTRHLSMKTVQFPVWRVIMKSLQCWLDEGPHQSERSQNETSVIYLTDSTHTCVRSKVMRVKVQTTNWIFMVKMFCCQQRPLTCRQTCPGCCWWGHGQCVCVCECVCVCVCECVWVCVWVCVCVSDCKACTINESSLWS